MSTCRPLAMHRRQYSIAASLRTRAREGLHKSEKFTECSTILIYIYIYICLYIQFAECNTFAPFVRAPRAQSREGARVSPE
jgi:hypothetical protein